MLATITVLLLSIPAGEAGNRGEQVRESMARSFSGTARIRTLDVAVTEGDQVELRRAGAEPIRSETLKVLMADVGDSVVGYGIAFDVPGKDQPITCLLLVDRSLRVLEVSILAYREPYGGEVRNSSWLAQFAGRIPGETLRPGREIRTISGATISCRSVTRGVQRVLALLALVTHRPPFQEIPR